MIKGFGSRWWRWAGLLPCCLKSTMVWVLAILEWAVFEAIGRNLSAQPLLSQAVMAPELLIRVGSSAQQAKWLPLLARR
ncbi:hypothetical protein J4711_13630 [Staphylococcus epidermidis]|nr:hypothetical protein [Staphylococcus epidermidis]